MIRFLFHLKFGYFLSFFLCLFVFCYFLSDIFIPQPRLDFYACVQAKKRKDSPHGKNTVRTAEGSVSEIEGLEFKNKLAVNPGSKKVSLGPYY
jgi:hypothetical protein